MCNHPGPINSFDSFSLGTSGAALFLVIGECDVVGEIVTNSKVCNPGDCQKLEDPIAKEQRRAARIVRLGISTLRYQSRKVLDEVLRRRLRELAGTYVRYGYRRLTVLLRREGWQVNAKRIYRLYRDEELIVRTKQRRKIARRQRVRTSLATRANQCWSMDFVSDKFADGRSFRILTVIDQFTRECVALEADRSMTGKKVAEVLERARQ